MYPFVGEPSLGAVGNWEASSIIRASCELKCSSSMAV